MKLKDKPIQFSHKTRSYIFMDQKWQPYIVTNNIETDYCIFPHHSTQKMVHCWKSYINFLLQHKKISLFPASICTVWHL